MSREDKQEKPLHRVDSPKNRRKKDPQPSLGVQLFVDAMENYQLVDRNREWKKNSRMNTFTRYILQCVPFMVWVTNKVLIFAGLFFALGVPCGLLACLCQVACGRLLTLI